MSRFISAVLRARFGVVVLSVVMLFSAVSASAQRISPSSFVQYPATGVWNTFLEQLNVLECNNYAASTVTAQVALRDSQGTTLNTIPFSVPASGTFHLVVNPLVPLNQYGTYTIDLPGASSEQTERFRCVTAVYRFAAAGAGKLLDYAYALPVMDPLTNSSGGTFNSYNPENGPAPVQNWLSIVNSGTSSLDGNLEIYDQSGTLLNTIPVSPLAAGARQDFPLGHDSAVNNGKVVGVYRFVPSNNARPYLAFLIRYSIRGSSFNYAFPLFASNGTCSAEPVFASTMNPADNWAELANLSGSPASLTLEVRNGLGAVLATQDIDLAAFEQRHVYVNQFLGTANTGVMRIACDSGSDRVLLQSVFYGMTGAATPTVAWSYAKQQVGASATGDQLLAVPINTFFGMANWFRVSERDLLGAPIAVNVFPQGGSALSLESAVPTAGSTDIPIHSVLAADKVGGTVADNAGAQTRTLIGDVIRVLPDSSNRIGTIMPIPAAVVSGNVPSVALQPFLSGFDRPILVTNAADGSNRIFIVEQQGRVFVYKNGALLQTPFLDIRDIIPDVSIDNNGERGLLSLAFHPNFESNRKFYVMYTENEGTVSSADDGDIVIAEILVPTIGSDTADRTTLRKLLDVEHRTFKNHNGGTIAFGGDGFLYITLGDGGSGGDPLENGQDLEELLGKMLRIDVDTGSPYGIPSSNPFVGIPGRDEIFAYGLRNTWRFSIDPTTQRIFAGDVGQGSLEEVDIIVSGGNYGWDEMEGTQCFEPSSNCNRTGKILPIHEYPHDATGGVSITGGHVYRGSDIPLLAGKYVFGDFATAFIWSLEELSDGTWQRRQLFDLSNVALSSFGEDEARELYVVTYGGAIFKLINAAS